MPGRKSICRALAGSIFDPTIGSVGKIGLVTVAVVRDPRHAIPLHGTFIGFPSDHLGMEVQVSVMSGTPEAIWPLLNAPRGHNSTNQFDRRRGQGTLMERIDIR